MSRAVGVAMLVFVVLAAVWVVSGLSMAGHLERTCLP